MFKYVQNRKYLLISDLRNGRMDGKMQHLVSKVGWVMVLYDKCMHVQMYVHVHVYTDLHVPYKMICNI